MQSLYIVGENNGSEYELYTNWTQYTHTTCTSLSQINTHTSHPYTCPLTPYFSGQIRYFSGPNSMSSLLFFFWSNVISSYCFSNNNFYKILIKLKLIWLILMKIISIDNIFFDIDNIYFALLYYDKLYLSFSYFLNK